MTAPVYPASADVVDSQPTSFQQYNNLRADALRFGAAAAEAVNLGELLSRYESNIRLELLSPTRLRLPASVETPAALVVDGCPLRVTFDVDLPAGVLSGPAATYYVFAARAPGSAAFTLEVNTTPTEASGRRRIGSFYWDGARIAPGSITTALAGHVGQLLQYQPAQHNQGRLTLATGAPASSADISGAGTLYFTPYRGNRVGLYAPGYGWRLHPFTELSVSLAGRAGGKNIDVFLYNDAGALALRLEEWASDLVRAAALARQDGVYVLADAPEQRYLGTLHTSAPGLCADSRTQRLVWNYDNRLRRPFELNDPTAFWSYSQAAYRPWNNSTAHRIHFVIGVDEDPLYAHFQCEVFNTTGVLLYAGLGLDSAAASGATVVTGAYAGSAHAVYHDRPGSGYHYLQALEYGYGGGESYFYGSNGPTRSGLYGYILA